VDGPDDDLSDFSVVPERGVPDFYTDSVISQTSFFGITLEFGRAQSVPGAPEGAAVPHIPLVRLHMSPQHAKVMLAGLQRNIALYEGKWGEIGLPREFLAAFEQQV
jgi:Protein of unknown function (DUF3467)